MGGVPGQGEVVEIFKPSGRQGEIRKDEGGRFNSLLLDSVIVQSPGRGDESDLRLALEEIWPEIPLEARDLLLRLLGSYDLAIFVNAWTAVEPEESLATGMPRRSLTALVPRRILTVVLSRWAQKFVSNLRAYVTGGLAGTLWRSISKSLDRTDNSPVFSEGYFLLGLRWIDIVAVIMADVIRVDAQEGKGSVRPVVLMQVKGSGDGVYVVELEEDSRVQILRERRSPDDVYEIFATFLRLARKFAMRS